MFRPRRELRLFGTVPIRHILLVVLVLGLAVTTLQVISLERERAAVEQSLSRREAGGPPVPSSAFGRARSDILKASGVLFFLAMAGIAAILTYHNYHSINRALERTKTLARNILQSIPTGVVTVDRRGRVTSANASAERMLGLGRRGVHWRPYRDVFRTQPELAEILRAALDDRVFTHEVELECAAGEAGQPVAARLTSSELQDPRGETVGVVLLLRDCSELVQLERQLRQADKMAALGTLSAGLAHEIKNPLSAIELNLHLLAEELAEREQLRSAVRRYLDILKAEIQRLQAVVENVVRVSRPTTPSLEPLDLNDLLAHVVALVQGEAREHKVELQVDLAPDLPHVAGDSTQLSQVFLNLLLNGLQAMPDGGTLAITSGPRLDPPASVFVRVSDTGHGIAPGYLSRLFDPYFTTRDGGTGLGLAIAYRIVRDHGGTIEVASTQGAGTCMTVRLPLSPRPQPVELG
ncbi:MAG: PAS domain-containing protein [candidate division NC10 bacterium]|nr:PAS domain-containing protein [candidate division NC10 bacterium]